MELSIDPILSGVEVGKLTNISEATRWRMIQRGDFPPAVRLGLRRCGWRESDIRAWLQSRTSGPMQGKMPTPAKGKRKPVATDAPSAAVE
jgi:prophage regulatory protein